MNPDEKKIEDFLQFIKESDPSKLAELLIAKGIPVSEREFIYHLVSLKAELVIASSTTFLNNTKDQAIVAEFLTDAIDKTELSTDISKVLSFSVAEMEISYKHKKTKRLFIDGANIAYQVFKAMWDQSLMEIQEQFCALFLNRAGAVLGFRLISTGTVRQCLVDYNLLASCALLCRATAVIVAHNHPSGNLEFSQPDIEMTVSSQKMLSLFDIKVLDHILITDGNYLSMKDSKTIAFNN